MVVLMVGLVAVVMSAVEARHPLAVILLGTTIVGCMAVGVLWARAWPRMELAVAVICAVLLGGFQWFAGVEPPTWALTLVVVAFLAEKMAPVRSLIVLVVAAATTTIALGWVDSSTISVLTTVMATWAVIGLWLALSWERDQTMTQKEGLEVQVEDLQRKFDTLVKCLQAARQPLHTVSGMAEAILVDDEESERHEQMIVIRESAGELMAIMHEAELAEGDFELESRAMRQPPPPGGRRLRVVPSPGEALRGEDGGRPLCLVVDDEPTNLQVLHTALARFGYVCHGARGGQEAVDAACRRRYDLIFMDCSMPDVDGYVATRHIRAAGPNRETPIIAVTAHGLVGALDDCLEAGMSDCLFKPVDFPLIESTAARWLGQRHSA